jgi:uncharacterized protein YdhG (YjbR/CyaY superfamily)
MKSTATTPEEYIAELPEDRKLIISKIRAVINLNLPMGFREEMSYGMIGYVVPHGLYPAGYGSTPKLPLPFMNLGSQKNCIVLHHVAIGVNPDLLAWFTVAYSEHCKTKLDMGVGCIRFKKMDDMPYDLIGQLASKMTVADWIKLYDEKFKRK